MNVLIASLALAATTLVPLNDLGPNPYMWGYYGGLWDVKNTGWVTIPPFHAEAGLQQAAKIVPRDASGNPDPNGKIVFLSIGYGNTERTFSQFQEMAAADSRTNHDSLVILNGAADHLDATNWDFAWKPAYDIVQRSVLAPANVTAAQVQAVWIQQINENPYTPLPIQYADSYLLKATLCDLLREAKQQYPNLAIAYLSSPEYAGYSNTKLLSEPFAYEDGFSPRWAILGQILYVQQGDQIWDPRIGPLDYNRGDAPWATWGPYLWANGMTPRSDGLTWQPGDFQSDGFTLSDTGAHKSAAMLLNFLMSEPTAAGWFATNAPAIPKKTRAVRH